MAINTKGLESAASSLENLEGQPLAIIRLGELIPASNATETRRRGAKKPAYAPSPADLDADLANYKEHYSKLRFRYLEQVTKEKFLRAIVGEPPQIVEPQENGVLEAQNAEAKAALKQQKADVFALKDELEALGRDLSQRHESITLQTTQLAQLPAEIEGLEETAATLREQQALQASNPSQSLPLAATLDLLAVKEAELDELDDQLKLLQNAMPRKTNELHRLEQELKPLEAQKLAAVAAAKDTMRRKEAGENGLGDDLELKGRWYRSVETSLKEMLEL